MSYCRFSEGDVYMYAESKNDGIVCCGCWLGKTELMSTIDAIDHLHEHVKAGHKVPQFAFDKLQKEIVK